MKHIDAEAEKFLQAVRVAMLAATDLYTQGTKLEEHEDELSSRMKDHKIPDEWFPLVRDVMYAFHSFATRIAEHTSAHNNAKRLRSARQAKMQPKFGDPTD